MEYTYELKVRLAKMLPKKFELDGKNYAYVYHASNITQHGLLVSGQDYDSGKNELVFLDFDKAYEIIYGKKVLAIDQNLPDQVGKSITDNSISHKRSLTSIPENIIINNDKIGSEDSSSTNQNVSSKGFNLFNVKNSLTLDWQYRTWKLCQYGILTFSIFNLLFEILLSGGKPNFILPVVVNYIISAWYLGRRISKGKKYNKPYLLGLFTAFLVFVIRLVAGMLVMILIDNMM